eukprot:GHVN01071112.1.p1 GENE.GHVN01071112.1~~GHVN01071112.1.p1  ORF type:complete len:830 (-),score=183.78 GHVN01071112.1:91-2250(-)
MAADLILAHNRTSMTHSELRSDHQTSPTPQLHSSGKLIHSSSHSKDTLSLMGLTVIPCLTDVLDVRPSDINNITATTVAEAKPHMQQVSHVLQLTSQLALRQRVKGAKQRKERRAYVDRFRELITAKQAVRLTGNPRVRVSAPSSLSTVDERPQLSNSDLYVSTNNPADNLLTDSVSVEETKHIEIEHRSSRDLRSDQRGFKPQRLIIPSDQVSSIARPPSQHSLFPASHDLGFGVPSYHTPVSSFITTTGGTGTDTGTNTGTDTGITSANDKALLGLAKRLGVRLVDETLTSTGVRDVRGDFTIGQIIMITAAMRRLNLHKELNARFSELESLLSSSLTIRHAASLDNVQIDAAMYLMSRLRSFLTDFNLTAFLASRMTSLTINDKRVAFVSSSSTYASFLKSLTEWHYIFRPVLHNAEAHHSVKLDQRRSREVEWLRGSETTLYREWMEGKNGDTRESQDRQCEVNEVSELTVKEKGELSIASKRDITDTNEGKEDALTSYSTHENKIKYKKRDMVVNFPLIAKAVIDDNQNISTPSLCSLIKSMSLLGYNSKTFYQLIVPVLTERVKEMSEEDISAVTAAINNQRLKVNNRRPLFRLMGLQYQKLQSFNVTITPRGSTRSSLFVTAGQSSLHSGPTNLTQSASATWRTAPDATPVIHSQGLTVSTSSAKWRLPCYDARRDHALRGEVSGPVKRFGGLSSETAGHKKPKFRGEGPTK